MFRKKSPYFENGRKSEAEGQFEKAYHEYKMAADRNDERAMAAIARMYLSGEFRPVTAMNFQKILQDGPVFFPWSMPFETKPDYEKAMEWLEKAAANQHDGALCVLGNMYATGMGCRQDAEKGAAYLKKAVALGNEQAKMDLCLYCPDGKRLSDEEYEIALDKFADLMHKKDLEAYALYATLKSGTDRQLARLGYELMAARNAGRCAEERFTHSFTSQKIPLIPAAAKRVAWSTFLRFDLNAFREESACILLSSDILDADNPGSLLDHFHRAQVVGKAVYRSPGFGWLEENKKAVVLRLGTERRLDQETLCRVAKEYYLIDPEYLPDNIAFLTESGEKEYSFEIAALRGGKVDVLWRYSIGGSDHVRRAFEPELISLECNE